jgi:predicted DNA-binding transcriptional regulator YafY
MFLYNYDKGGFSMNYLLKYSLTNATPVEIIYQGKDNQFSKRPILVKAINETYIKAYCLTKRQPRIFKIDSIFAVAPIQKKGERYYA